MSRFKKLFRSLPLKLSIIITLVILVIAIVVTLSITSLVYKNMYEDAEERSFNAINNISRSMQINIAECVDEVSNAVITIENSLDEIHKITNFFVVENSWVATAKFAYLEGKGEDCAYITYRDSTGTIVDKKFTNKEDYANWDWYKNAVDKPVPTWSEPFYNHTQGIVVATYSYPIRDPETDEIVAIWAVDAKYINLTYYIDSYMPYSNAWGYIVHDDGYYLSNPNKGCELLKYDEIDEKYKSDSEKDIYDLILSMDEGSEVIDINGKKHFVYFCPEPWMSSTFAIICPSDDILKDVLDVQSSLWNIFIITIIFFALFIFGLVFYIMKPLSGFAKAVRALANGKFDAPIPIINYKDELRDFYDALSLMQDSLISNIEKLKQSSALSARIEGELLLAKQIQTNLLSQNFSPYLDYPQLGLFAKLKPAREVGGDLYDFFVRDSKLFFSIADVSGKGVPASLFMAMAYKVFRVIANREDSTAAIATQLNAALAENNDDNMFVTMFIGILDLRSGDLLYTNAGHNPPLVISSKNSYMDVKTSVPIAAFDNTEYTEDTIRLEDGSALILYTDGVVEAENKDQELYGEERLLSLINDRFISSQDIVNKVYSSTIEFSGGADQTDDITLLCIKYYKNAISFERIEDLDALRSFVKLSLDKNHSNYDYDELQESMINLALEELLVNALTYSNTPRVSLSVNYIDDGLKFTIIDSGIAFDPTTSPNIDISVNPEERNVGGLGIHLAKEIFSNLEYKRFGVYNVLYTIYKNK